MCPKHGTDYLECKSPWWSEEDLYTWWDNYDTVDADIKAGGVMVCKSRPAVLSCLSCSPDFCVRMDLVQRILMGWTHYYGSLHPTL